MVFISKTFQESISGKGFYGDRETYNKGYHGLGDPEDKSLNELEVKVAIPCLEKEIILRDYCSNENQEYAICRDNTFFFNRFYACSEKKRNLYNCIEYWKSQLDLKKQATAEYLEERTRYRSTGLNKWERECEMSATEERVASKLQKLRSFILKDEEMKQYEANVQAAKSKKN